MEIGVTVTVPLEVYNIYVESASMLGDYTVQQVMAQVLCAYAKCVSDGLKAENSAKEDCQLN